MLIEQTIEKLALMKLHGMSQSLKERLAKPDHRDLSFTELIGLVVDDEWIYRTNKRLSARLRNAKFKDPACLENIDYSTPRGLKKSHILELAQGHWVKEHQNILITGPSGSGKSYLAQAFGNHLCRSDFSVLYFRMNKLAIQLTQSRADGTLLSFLKRILKANILIIDDWGLTKLTEEQRNDFLEIYEDRYGVGSTVITSQMPTAEWHTYLGGGRLADAICDRLVHNAHKIDLMSKDSMRKVKSKLTGGGSAEKL